MASGFSLIINCYGMDVFGEAARSDGGAIRVDFLSGEIVEGDASESLRRAAALFAEALPEFCQQHGAAADDFAELFVTFSSDPLARKAILAVTDKEGGRSVTEYEGNSLRRKRYLDSLGRIRRAPRKTEARKVDPGSSPG